jgi:lysyl-tRNA synthetase class 2
MSGTGWRPTAHRERLRQRARLLAAARDFFAAREVLEVETPVLVNAGVTDVNLRPVAVQLGSRGMFLHTSPEYAMKRLLAAGCGDLYQICRVVRGEERGPLHNPEFTLLEWYRTGFSLGQLVDEVAALLDVLMQSLGEVGRPLRRLSYRQAFAEMLGVDPLDTDRDRLAGLAAAHGLAAETARQLDRDGLLDFLVGAVIGPRLGHGEWLALTHYPATQAALARLDPLDPQCALRFEMYADGIELANGFEELADATEQRTRFAADNAARAATGLPQLAVDEQLLGALEAGLPPCAGVALGFDRLVMVATGARRIDDVMAFPVEIA